MAKWIFAVLALLATGAHADGLSPQGDGCALLNEIIYEEVTAAGWGMTGADLVHTNFNEPSVVVCTSTTQAASAAFASAVSAVGGEVSWDRGGIDPADTCLSGFIEQCLPRYSSLMQPQLASSAVLSWQGISEVVVAAMADGSATDRSIFSPDSMRRAVRSELGRTWVVLDSY